MTAGSPARVVAFALAAACALAPAAARAEDDGHDLDRFRVLLDVDGAADVRVREVDYASADGAPLRASLFRRDDVGRGAPLATVVLIDTAGRADGVPARAKEAFVSRGRLLAASGLGAAIFDLRPGHVEADLDAAFAFLRDEGRKHGVDPDRIGVWALDGGDRDALAALARGERPGVRCVALYPGAIDAGGAAPDVPVLMVIAGRDRDETVAAMRRFAADALAAGAAIEVVQVPEARHAFDLVDDTERTREVLRRTLAFFHEHLESDADPAIGSSLTPLQAATAHYVSEEWDEAAREYLGYAWQSPDDAVAQFRMADAAVRAGRCEQALPALARAADAGHRKGEALILAAGCQARAGEPDLAVENLRRAAIVEPERLASAYADPALASLRGREDFRALLRERAVWSEVRMAGPAEPGTPLVLTLRLTRADGTPAVGARVYAYQTGADGRYPGADPAQGDPRLFGHAVAGPDGAVVLVTVRPGAYPGGRVPEHVHYEIEVPGGATTVGEVRFADDPRLDEAARRDAAGRGWPVVAPVAGDDGVARAEARVRLR